eukprot:4959343-Pyramimonas_sp.AAC.1
MHGSSTQVVARQRGRADGAARRPRMRIGPMRMGVQRREWRARRHRHARGRFRYPAKAAVAGW